MLCFGLSWTFSRRIIPGIRAYLIPSIPLTYTLILIRVYPRIHYTVIDLTTYATRKGLHSSTTVYGRTNNLGQHEREGGKKGYSRSRSNTETRTSEIAREDKHERIGKDKHEYSTSGTVTTPYQTSSAADVSPSAPSPSQSAPPTSPPPPAHHPPPSHP